MVGVLGLGPRPDGLSQHADSVLRWKTLRTGF